MGVIKNMLLKLFNDIKDSQEKKVDDFEKYSDIRLSEFAFNNFMSENIDTIRKEIYFYNKKAINNINYDSFIIDIYNIIYYYGKDYNYFVDIFEFNNK